MYAMQQQQLRDEGADDESDSDDDDEDQQEGLPVNYDFNNNEIVFPALPSMVYAVEPESDAEVRSNGGAGHGSEREESTDAVLATKDILCDA